MRCGSLTNSAPPPLPLCLPSPAAVLGWDAPFRSVATVLAAWRPAERVLASAPSAVERGLALLLPTAFGGHEARAVPNEAARADVDDDDLKGDCVVRREAAARAVVTALVEPLLRSGTTVAPLAPVGIGSISGTLDSVVWGGSADRDQREPNGARPQDCVHALKKMRNFWVS